MFIQAVMVNDQTQKEYQEYKDSLNKMGLTRLVKEFFSYLDYTEESESGREFHPICVSSCRALMTEPLGEVLKELRTRLGEP